MSITGKGGFYSREQVPATTLAREAIDCWLRQQLRGTRHDRMAAYAAEMAGTHLDLDPDLEAAGIEHLVKTGKAGTLPSASLREVEEALRAAMDLD